MPVQLSEPITDEKTTMPSTGTVSTGSKFRWQTFDARQAFATLTPGSIRLSSAAAMHLAEMERAELLYDRERQAIGIRPVAKASPTTFKLSRNATGCSISARPFLELVDFSGIATGKPPRFRAVWDAAAGVLVIIGVPFRKAA